MSEVACQDQQRQAARLNPPSTPNWRRYCQAHCHRLRTIRTYKKTIRTRGKAGIGHSPLFCRSIPVFISPLQFVLVEQLMIGREVDAAELDVELPLIRFQP